MAKNYDQLEPALPAGDNKPLRETSNHLPRYFRTEFNKKFLNATLDQMVTPGQVEKLNGYYGRKNAKAYVATDNYIGDVSAARESYQFEPVSIIKDGVGNVDFYADYNDYINTIDILAGSTADQSKLNSQEYYVWDPHVDWDKFINFRNYYWLPDGPETVTVVGRVKEITSTFDLKLKEEDENILYQFTPDGLTGNRTLTLYRGQTYRFEINVPSYAVAFATKVSFVPGRAILIEAFEGLRRPGVYDYLYYDQTDTRYDAGGWLIPPRESSFTEEEQENASLLYRLGMKFFDVNGIERDDIMWMEKGVIEWTIPETAPDILYYVSKDNANTSGMIKIHDIIEATEIDVEEEIIGKKTYVSESEVQVEGVLTEGISLTNGMKVNFVGTVFPEKYATGEWYVEGVGDKIELISSLDLDLQTSFVSDFEIEFDNAGFDYYPYAEAFGWSDNKDYIVINRGSGDGNLWSRNNRWFHIETIEKSLQLNGQIPAVDQDARAKRPIIEFERGLKLFNFGTGRKRNVDVVDTVTKDIFSQIEGSFGYNVDKVDLSEGMRVLFTADTDIRVNGRIFKVKFITHNNSRQITLVEEDDTEPLYNETVLSKQGEQYKGKFFHYDGEKWIQSQDKTDVNQPPLFDLYDFNNNSFLDPIYYKDSQFIGNKLFSYKEGEGTVDSELGFALSYQNIQNSGDILFNFDLVNQYFLYTNQNNAFAQQDTQTSFLRKYTTKDDYVNVNGYTIADNDTSQIVLKQYDANGTTQTFAIDMYDDTNFIKEAWLKVYRNNVLLAINNEFEVFQDVNDRSHIRILDRAVEEGDIILIKVRADYPKNNNGYYELPYNLEKNPGNATLKEFTLGEVVDHVSTIVEELQTFTGSFPGLSNLRDLGNVSKYGRKFLKHSAPFNLSAYHLLNDRASVVDAIELARKEYGKFKRAFLEIAENLGYDGPIKQHVDQILKEFVKDKQNTLPYYFSDMVPIGGEVVNREDIYDSDQEYFALSQPFDINEPSLRAAQVYINGRQLTHEKDYTFTEEGFVRIHGHKNPRDIVEIYEYETTVGSYIPPTPTKLGLYPKYEPMFYIDDTVQKTPDIANTGPYTIYGQAAPGYPGEGRVGWFHPVYTDRDDAVTKDESLGGTGNAVTLRLVGLNRVFYIPESQQFIAVQQDPAYIEYDEGTATIQCHDGSYIVAFKDYRDELILELEKRIYNNIKVQYDPKLFNIHSYIDGVHRKGSISRSEIDTAMINDFLAWKRLINREYTDNLYLDSSNSFTYNYKDTRYYNGETAPGWWRQIYKYAFDTDRPHTHPWEMLGFTVKPAWWEEQYGAAPYTRNNLLMWRDIQDGIIRQPKFEINNLYVRPNLLQNIPVDENGFLISPNDCNLLSIADYRKIGTSYVFGDGSPAESAWRRSSEFPFALIKGIVVNRPSKAFSLIFDRIRQKKNLANQLIYTNTQNHITTNSLVYPLSTTETEGHGITSGLINYITDYRAVLVQERYNDYKYDLSALSNQLSFKVGGYTDKSKFKLILDSRSPYNEGNVFVPDENYNIVLGTSYPITEFSYSGVIIEKKADGFYVKGYDNRLPVFRYYRPFERQADSSINVGGVSENFLFWGESKTYAVDTIVKFEGGYYRCKTTHVSTQEFDPDKFQRLPQLPTVGGVNAVIRTQWSKTLSTLNYGSYLATVQDVVDFLRGYGLYLESIGFSFSRFIDEAYDIADWMFSAKQFMFWVTQNWDEGSLITLSPGAERIEFKNSFAMVSNVFDTSTGYSVLRADGTPLKSKYLKVNRDNENNFSIRTSNTTSGIYAIKIPIVIKEHIVLIDNRTVFNDVIYDPPTGYRQERIKVSGYRVDGWNGSLFIPGFIFDEARCTDWRQYKDYDVGDLVKYKEYYYAAQYKVPGSAEFVDFYWIRLDDKPESKLYANFDYRADQFRDFYDLDSDNFDSEQQRMAQHIIGYQKRNYLQNIINNDVSQYKFYQGFILEKGTRNSLTKLFDALSSADKDSLEFYEEWAIKNGQYGAATGFDEVEYILDEKQFRLVPQPILLTNSFTGNETDLIYRIKESEVYLKPEGYNHKPFPSKYVFDTYTKNSGYVNSSDVNYILGQYYELLSLGINEVKKKEYIWVGNVNEDWNVYQYTIDDLKITSVQPIENENEKFIILLDGIPKDIVPGDIIGMMNLESSVYEELTDSAIQLKRTQSRNEGFFVVDQIVLNEITLSADMLTITKVREESLDECTGLLTKFVPVRVADVPALSNIAATGLDVGSRIWLDDIGTGAWKVLEKDTDIDTIFTGVNSEEGLDHNFGVTMSTNDRNNILIVGAPTIGDGKVYIYSRSNQNMKWKLSEVLEPDLELADTSIPQRFGASVDISPDGKYAIVGAPDASYIVSNSQGLFDPTKLYDQFSIVEYGGVFWEALVDVRRSTEYVTFNSFYNVNQSIVEFDLDDDDDPELNLLLTGDYPKTAQETNHFLVRLPSQMYKGVTPGDKIYLKWNSITNANQTQFNLEAREPFNGAIPELLGDNITGEHTVVGKVDAILLIENLKATPGIGDQVSTTNAVGRVAYIRDFSGLAIIYINEAVGTFPFQDTLITPDRTIGDFQLQAPISYDNPNISDNYGGYVMINTPAPYNVEQTVLEGGRGLIITDVITDNSPKTRYYYNILDYDTEIEYGDNTEHSMVHVFSRRGTRLINAGMYADDDIVLPYYGVRAPKELSDNIVSGDTMSMYFNKLKKTVVVLKVRNTRFSSPPKLRVGERITQHNSGAYATVFTDTVDVAEETIDPTNPVYNIYVQFLSPQAEFNRTDELFGSISGELYIRPVYEPVIDKLVSIEEIGIDENDFIQDDNTINVWNVWDGFIDYSEEYYSSEGLPYIPRSQYIDNGLGDLIDTGNAPHVVRQVDTGATAEVKYVQRLTNKIVRIYVDNVQGNWTVGTKYDEIKEIEMLAYPTAVDDYGRANIYAIVRQIGNIIRTSVGYPSEGIGKMIVIRAGSSPQIIIDEDTEIQRDEMVGEEYWFFTNNEVSGVLEMDNTPNQKSTVWKQVYNIEATSVGTPSDYIYEGLAYVYQKFGNNFVRDKVILSPQRDNSIFFGEKVQVRKSAENFYKGYVLAAAGAENLTSPGKIYFLKQGQEGSEYYNWDYARDKNFKGEYNEEESYFVGDTIYRDTRILQALTNMLPGPFNSLYWGERDELIDYVGYIPNDLSYTALVGDDESSRLDLQKLFDFGTQFDVSDDSEVIAAYIKYLDQPNVIAIYRNYKGQYIYSQSIVAPTTESGFGESLSLNGDGSILVVGAPFDDSVNYDQGRVYVYTLQNQQLELFQTIDSPNDDTLSMFGITVDIDKNHIAIGAKNGDVTVSTTYDEGTTTFDMSFTTFAYELKDTGAVYFYERISNKYVYGSYVSYEDPTSNVYDFGKFMYFHNDHLYAGLPILQTDTNQGVVVDFYKKNNFYKTIRDPKVTVDVDKIKQVLLYNKKTKQVITYLDYIDPLQNKLPGVADENIRYKLYYDPAFYTEGEFQVNPQNAWGEKQVGQLWWNLTNAKYYYPYQDDITFSTNIWSKTFATNSIDIFEWVETTYLPEEWDALADTLEGLADGISGTTLYGNNSYVIKRSYDAVAQIFTYKYYYWVKNKRVKPNDPDRTMSAFDVAQVMQDPAQFGYVYMSFISDDSIAVYNAASLLQDKNVVLSIQYWTTKDQRTNIHNEYQLVTENDAGSVPKRDIESKWIDSLVGYDKFGRAVPDLSLDEKYRYGTLNEPRQGWFVNRIEACKVYFERINYVLKQHLIVDSKSLTKLYTADEYPAAIYNQYDITVDTRQDLNNYGTTKIEQASATLEIVDGNIKSIFVTNPGRGYLVPPTYEIPGKGEGAEIEFTINSLGSIATARVVSEGYNYSSSAQIVIRQFTALVLSDDTVENKWALYIRDQRANSWQMTRVQGYDTSLYWQFIDWYDVGYSNYVKINYNIDYAYQLESINDEIGDIVKISSIGSGGWLLLEKINDIERADYTVNYKTIGREKGTIEFLKTLYDYNAGEINFDIVNFDTGFYDPLPSTEIRIIANAIKDDIFVEELAIEYNKLFFASIRYVLSEQNYVDWLFKTSFLRAKHNVGSLHEDVTFNNDYLPSYQDYISEVKSFKSKIREYISSYEKVDNTNTRVTDFDLAPYYDDEIGAIVPFEVKAYNDGLLGTYKLDQYPAKNWFDNCRFEVKEIRIIDGGKGYQSPPQVLLTGGGGAGAKVKTHLGVNGTVRRVEVLDSGTGFISVPTVTINGSLDEEGYPMRVSVVLGNPLPRSFTSTIKFDRVSGKFDITDLAVTETIISSGSQYQFKTEWPIDLNGGRTIVTVDGLETLSSELSYENVLDTSKGYDRYTGVITLSEAPAKYAEIVITYHKSPDLLTAQDRINMFYNPEIGQLGKDLSQLMDGIDYGGVEVRSFDFGGKVGWDSDGYYEASYDSYDTTYTDQIMTVLPKLRYIPGLDRRTYVNWDKIAQHINALAFSGEVRGQDITDPDNPYPFATSAFVYLFSVDKQGNRMYNTYDNSLPGEDPDPVTYEDFVNFASILNVANEAQVGHKSAYAVFQYATNSLENEEYIANIENYILSKLDSLTEEECLQLVSENILEEVKFITTDVIPTGDVYNFYHNGVRLDDDNFDSGAPANPNAVMQTIVGNNQVYEILVKTIVPDYQAGDTFTLRKPSSDGSFLPSDTDYDTQLSGGALDYANAKGITADDIVIDGDNFVTPTTSKGPEEVVPGQIVDALDIQVFDRPTPGVSTITSRNFTTDGVTKEFPIGTVPLTEYSLLVKLDNKVKRVKTDYIIDAQRQVIQFKATPRANRKLSMITLDYSGTDVLAVETISGTGVDKVFDTVVRWQENLHAQVSVNSETVDFVIKEDSNGGRNAVIEFGSEPELDAIIRYAIFKGDEKPYSTVTVDEFKYDGSSLNYVLSQTPMSQDPPEWFTLVIAGEELLNPGYVETFTVTDVLEYRLKLWQVPLSSVGSEEIRVFLNDSEIELYKDYRYSALGEDNPLLKPSEQEGSMIVLERGVAQPGDILKVYIIGLEGNTNSGGDYRYGYYDENGIFVKTPGVLWINKELEIDTPLRVYQFSNHDTQGIDWQSFDVVERTKLSQGVVEDRLVYIVQDTSATVSLSFELKYGELYSITVNDIRVDDINFGTGIPTTNPFAKTKTIVGDGSYSIHLPTIGNFFVENDYIVIEKVNAQITLDEGSADWYEYRQLLNGIIPLNRPAVEDHYVWVAVNGNLLAPSVDYHITNNKRFVRLAKHLSENDNVQTIHFSGKPGAMRVGWRQFKDSLNRNHYSIVDGSTNVKLKQDLNWYDKFILVENADKLPDPGQNAKRPAVIFINKERIEYYQIVQDRIQQLRRGTLGTGVPTVHPTGTEIYNQSMTTQLPYKDETIVTPFVGDGSTVRYELDFEALSVNHFEVYVAGRRLRKTELQLFDSSLAQDSPEGDITLPPEFTLDGNTLVLLEAPADKQKIQVIRRLGKLWTNGDSIQDSNSAIAKMIRSVQVDAP